MEQTKKVYVLLRYAGSGSGTLTYPEDFEFIRAYKNKDEAEEEMKRLSKEAFKKYYGEDEEYDEDEDCYEPDIDRFDVEELNLVLNFVGGRQFTQPPVNHKEKPGFGSPT